VGELGRPVGLDRVDERHRLAVAVGRGIPPGLTLLLQGAVIDLLAGLDVAEPTGLRQTLWHALRKPPAELGEQEVDQQADDADATAAHRNPAAESRRPPGILDLRGVELGIRIDVHAGIPPQLSVLVEDRTGLGGALSHSGWLDRWTAAPTPDPAH
jgi:hypothetical protein